VLELGGGQGFAEEPEPEGGAGGFLLARVQHLDGDGALQVRVVAEIHGSHAAASEHATDFEPVDVRQLGPRRHERSLWRPSRRCGTNWPGTPSMGCPKCGRLGFSFKAGEIRAGIYGTWATHTTVVSFDPHPKRERQLTVRGAHSPLIVRDLGGVESAPFVPGRTTPEAEGSRELRELAEDG